MNMRRDLLLCSEVISNVLYSTVYREKNTRCNEAAVDGIYPTNNADLVKPPDDSETPQDESRL